MTNGANKFSTQSRTYGLLGVTKSGALLSLVTFVMIQVAAASGLDSLERDLESDSKAHKPASAHSAPTRATQKNQQSTQQNAKRKASKKRKPASIGDEAATQNMKMPLLPDGTPDYSKFPNPFVVKRWSFDLGGVSGTSEGVGYSEVGLGVSMYFYDFLAWHNEAFMRQGPQQLMGLDTSERLIYEFSRSSGLALFAAPGYRFAGQASAPLLEVGITYSLSGFSITAGTRELVGSWITTAATNETQFFIQLASGGRP